MKTNMKQLNTMPQVLEQLAQGFDLSHERMAHCFDEILQGALNPIEVAALLTALKVKGEHVQELLAAADIMRKHAVSLPLKTKQFFPLVDCCGTGGDGMNTYNISTLSALVLASLKVPVAKHGNGKVSSSCGSADLLKAMGLKLDQSPEQAVSSLEKNHFCFLLAPKYHPAAGVVQPIRQALKTKTIFNLLGPLMNPAPLTHQLVGVYDPSKMEMMIQVLKAQGLQAAMVVHGSGLDELAVHGPSEVLLLKDGSITRHTIHPEQVGLRTYPIEDLVAKNPEQQVAESVNLLKGHGQEALKASVALNVGAVLSLTELSPTLTEGVKLALQTLSTDQPFMHLMSLLEDSPSC